MARHLPALAALAMLAVTLPLASSLDPASAQPSPAPGDAADWVPFIGSHAVGCTRANQDNPGCEVHHPTWAIDLAMPTDKRIRAAGPGIVVGVARGCAPLGGDGECNGGAGNMVVIAHGDYWSRYLHLSKIPKRIRPGREVEAGDLVGRAGASGTFGGVHLHYDEYQPGPPRGRVAFGKMFACHGGDAVIYPDVLGHDTWDAVPRGSIIRNDGYDCTGHPPQPHPPAPEPPVYPKGEPLGIGGSQSVAVADIDADGDMDVIVGAPGANADGNRRAGMVAAVDPFDLDDTMSLVQEQSMLGRLEGGDLVGASVISGDFDCDDRADVAVGAPGEDLAEPFTDAGAVNVVYGDGDEQLLYAGQVIDAYYLRPSDWLGAALAVGDFDDDGCDDLAIAAPGADRSAGLDMGMVWALSGSPDGLVRPFRLLQGINLGGVLESHDQTGYALATGDFNCDGVDDLVAGAPREVIDDIAAGAVLAVYGSRGGFFGGEALFQGQGLAGTLGQGERTGMAIAGGDIDGDGCDDIAVGAPGEAVAGRANAGAVLVTFGDPSGLAGSERQLEMSQSDGLRGRPRKGDRVGSAVALADVNCDGHADLAAGAPGRNLGKTKNAGAVIVRSGTPSGLDGIGWLVRQGRNLAGKKRAGAKVGSGITTADVDLDACADLLISAPGTRVRDLARAGAVHIQFGAGNISDARPPIRLDQRRAVPGTPTRRGLFGGSSPTDLFKNVLE